MMSVSHNTRHRKEQMCNMNISRLKGKIVERGLNTEKLATLIGMDRSSLYRKLNNGDKITIGEAVRIKNVLEMTNEEATEIFFS